MKKEKSELIGRLEANRFSKERVLRLEGYIKDKNKEIENLKSLAIENKFLKEENEKFYKIIQTLSADNQRFRARLDMLGEKE